MVTAGLSPRQALAGVEARLAAAGCPDAAFDARELFRLAAGRDARLSDRPLSAEEAARLEAVTARRAAREPLQYICGRWPFLTFELAVGPGVLCPRPDTEVVAEAAVQMLAGVENPRVLDLCAGTGCLGLGVKALRPDARVTCLEKSPEALPYLRLNARCALSGALEAVPGGMEDLLEPDAFDEAALYEKLGLSLSAPPAVEVVEGDLFAYWQSLPEGELDLIVSNPPYLTAEEMAHLQPETAREPAMSLSAPPAVEVVEGDLFACWQSLPEGELDLIVSNPPYLTAEEMAHLQPETAREPAMALAAGPDGLDFYRALASRYKAALRPGGALVLEIGWQQRQAVAALLESAGWADIACRKDYGGNDRCITARRPAGD